MDRIDAMSAFVAALDERQPRPRRRRLGRSPAAITRAVAQLEEHVGTHLLHRTTRALHLTEANLST